MNKFYFTFGQNHAHSVEGKTFDKDCVVEIEAESSGKARDKRKKSGTQRTGKRF